MSTFANSGNFGVNKRGILSFIGTSQNTTPFCTDNAERNVHRAFWRDVRGKNDTAVDFGKFPTLQGDGILVNQICTTKKNFPRCRGGINAMCGHFADAIKKANFPKQ
jgi:hypothetical protein